MCVCVTASPLGICNTQSCHGVRQAQLACQLGRPCTDLHSVCRHTQVHILWGFAAATAAMEPQLRGHSCAIILIKPRPCALSSSPCQPVRRRLLAPSRAWWGRLCHNVMPRRTTGSRRGAAAHEQVTFSTCSAYDSFCAVASGLELRARVQQAAIICRRDRACSCVGTAQREHHQDGSSNQHDGRTAHLLQCQVKYRDQEC